MCIRDSEGLCNEAFLKERADNVAELKAHVQAFTPEAMSAICGVAADTIREVARAYATAKAAMMYMPRTLCGSLSGASALCMISTTV